MSKSKKKSTPKPRPNKYAEKIKVNASFLDVMKVIVKDADAKNKNTNKKNITKRNNME